MEAAEDITGYMPKNEIGKREASTVNYLKQKYEKLLKQPAAKYLRK